MQQAAVPRAQVETQKLAEGVWLLGGSSHNSVAVEFKNHVAVIEAPLDEQRSLAVIAEVVKLVPNKPIRFIINTHAHYDHLGGLRTYLHVGATVITHQRNRVFYETELLNYVPRTLQPDMVSLYPPTEISEGYTMEDVDEKYVLTDGTRNLEIYYVQGLAAHVEGMLMAYLPKEKIIIEADLYDPPASDERFAGHFQRDSPGVLQQRSTTRVGHLNDCTHSRARCAVERLCQSGWQRRLVERILGRQGNGSAVVAARREVTRPRSESHRMSRLTAC